MIELTKQSGSPRRVETPAVHPDWQAWIDASAYQHADARRELGLANGTFYRRIAKAPTLIDQLAMRALYEGLEPFATKRIEG
jgi:hypothetical protein